jgi:hypothetical protein
LIQAGTNCAPNGTTLVCLPFTETIPEPSINYKDHPIKPGTLVTGSIKQVNETLWHVDLVDKNSKETILSISLEYVSFKSSAEWVLEAPSKGNLIMGTSQSNLFNFGKASFYDCSITVDGVQKKLGGVSTLTYDIAKEHMQLTKSEITSDSSFMIKYLRR